MKPIPIRFAAAAVLFALLPRTPAQQPARKVEFEVVSIKPAPGGARTVRTSKGRFEARNLRLSELVVSAFRLNSNQLDGGPNWLNTAAWDVDGKFPEGAGPAQLSQMLQSMLADRFHLVCHMETRSLPVYLLQVAKGGHKLKETTATDVSSSAGPRMIKYSAATIDELARQLTSYMQRQVIDRTELKGRYEINLSFAPVDLDPSIQAAADETRPSIFKALQEQAGLRLDSGKGPVSVLVIDKAERPSEN